MSTELRVRRMHHSLHPATADQRARLERTVAALPAALGDAFDACDLDPDAVVCVRKLACRVRLVGGTDLLIDPDKLAARWARVIVGRVADLTHIGEPARVIHLGEGQGEGDKGEAVWFPHRRAVVADVVRCAARGDSDRRWAWEVAGVVHRTDPVAIGPLAAVVLIRHPGSIAATVAWLARRHPHVVSSWRLSTWSDLAAAWAHGSGEVSPTLLAAAREFVGSEGAPVLPATHAIPARVAAAVSNGPVPTAIRRVVHSEAGGGADVPGRVALAALALAAEAPALATRPASVASVAELIADDRHSIVTRRTDLQPPFEPQGAAMATRSQTPAAPDVVGEIDSQGQDEPVHSFETRAGGLLFLVHVVASIDLPARVLDPTHPLSTRPFAEVMSLLGQALSGRPAHDPAVLAFTGRLPDDVDVDASPAAPTSSDEAAISVLVAEIDEALLRLLNLRAEEGPAGDGRDVRAFVIDRRATIGGDPGWIEATFDADSASIDIRRAGLDFDPLYVPFLGCVMRFRYV